MKTKKEYGLNKPHFIKGDCSWRVQQVKHSDGWGATVKYAWKNFKRCNLIRWGKATTFTCEAYNKQEKSAKKKALS